MDTETVESWDNETFHEYVEAEAEADFYEWLAANEGSELD